MGNSASKGRGKDKGKDVDNNVDKKNAPALQKDKPKGRNNGTCMCLCWCPLPALEKGGICACCSRGKHMKRYLGIPTTFPLRWMITAYV